MGKIVWLASYPKSGNTWLRVFLQNLIQKQGKVADINQLTDLTESEASLSQYRLIDKRSPDQWSAQDIDRMRAQVQETIAGSNDGRVFCKTHSALVAVRGRPTINPAISAGAIYIIRNPLDVAVSFADFAGVPIDTMIEWMAAENFEIPTDDLTVKCPLGSWSQHVGSWTWQGQRGAHVVRYEDMTLSPTKTFAGVAKFLKLNAPRDRLERAIANSSFRELRAQEDQKGFDERSKRQDRFFRKGATGQWKTALTNNQVARIVETHRTQMQRFGYLQRQT